MYDKINTLLFTDKNHSEKMLFGLAVFFPLFTIVALGIDSVYFTAHYFDGRQITNFLVVVYFSFMYWFADAYLRKLMFVMVFLSYIGELIFCTVLGLYDYRTVIIPLYVPFGHAIVYVSGYVFAYTDWAIRNDKSLRKYFAIAFLLLFLSVGIFLEDAFTLILGFLFFLILKRKRWQNLYYFIAVCVLIIELTGTYFQCWKWIPRILGVLPTANPPMGAVFFYAGGDVLLSKIVDIWNAKTVDSGLLAEE